MYRKEKDPLLELILQKYIQTSKDSIRGPVALKADSQLVCKSPLISKKVPEIPDEAKLIPTNLDNNNLGSFSIGGEKRLCFTELVQTVLKDVNMQDIFKKRDNLLIFTSKCTQKQLDELKYHGVLPWTSTSSNLISKSDAYRLCGALQGPHAPKADTSKRYPLTFEVYHECFGGCIGQFSPELYTEVDALCIRCSECNGLFSTQKFVSHNHSSFDEVHTCHWGFDSTKWRIYIMLVEQKPTRDLNALWDSVKYKFDSNGHPTVPSFSNVDRRQDADFVAYINSPDHKKAMVSPIENLRNQEARIEHKERYKESAFRPWSPKYTSKSYSRDEESRHSSHFIFPSNSSRIKEKNDMLYANHECTQCPKSSMYMDCQQCKNAAQASCPNGLQMLAQKASERPTEHSKKEVCNCEKCRSNYPVENVEGQFEEIIKSFTSKENKLTTSTRDLARLLSSELKRMQISQEEKVREFSISNQRLQTELQLVKLESQKKISEARDTKAHVEQELESLHRERQQEISIFNRLRYELQEDGSRKTVERDNHHQFQKRNTLSSWTPYPTIGRQFSDSEESTEDVKTNLKNTKPEWPAQHLITTNKPSTSGEFQSGQLSPVSKSRKIDDDLSGDDSDIEVDK